jgi:hypothetical protein
MDWMLEFVVVRGDVKISRCPTRVLRRRTHLVQRTPNHQIRMIRCSIAHWLIVYCVAQPLRLARLCTVLLARRCSVSSAALPTYSSRTRCGQRCSFYASCDTYSVAFRHANSRTRCACCRGPSCTCSCVASRMLPRAAIHRRPLRSKQPLLSCSIQELFQAHPRISEDGCAACSGSATTSNVDTFRDGQRL